MGKRVTKIVEITRSTLRRVLGIPDLFAVGYADLGSDIFFALGVTAIFALGATPIALALAGVVFVCTALTYSEMSSIIHESGGSASFTRYVFNDLVSFVCGWGLLLDYIVTIAISAFAAVAYLSYFYSFPTVIKIGATIGFIFILMAINIFGVRRSTRMSLYLVTFTIFVQLIIILIGMGTVVDIPSFFDHMKINGPDKFWSPSWSDFWKGTAMAMVAFLGIESITQLGSETKKPEMTVPRSIIVTMVILLILYFGLSIVALSAMTPHDLNTTYVDNPIAGIVAALPFGKAILAPLVAIMAAILLFTASNSGLVGASRLTYNMGEYYQLPQFFNSVHPRFRTPYVALIFFAIFAGIIVLASRGKMEFLADLYNFGAMIAFCSAHLSLLFLRAKKPDLKRPFRLGLNIKFRNYEFPITAIIGALATAGVWVLIVITKPYGRYLGLAWLVGGTLMYLYYRKKQRIAPAGTVSIEKIKVPIFEPTKVKHILLPTRGSIYTESVQVACELAKLHKAKLTIVHIIEVSHTMPLDADMSHHELAGQAILKSAEAIARKFNIEIERELIRSYSIPEAIVELSAKGKYDLLVLGAMKGGSEFGMKSLGPITEKIIKHAKCRIWVCVNEAATSLNKK